LDLGVVHSVQIHHPFRRVRIASRQWLLLQINALVNLRDVKLLALLLRRQPIRHAIWIHLHRALFQRLWFHILLQLLNVQNFIDVRRRLRLRKLLVVLAEMFLLFVEAATLSFGFELRLVLRLLFLLGAYCCVL
jgi:hypothetical protein